MVIISIDDEEEEEEEELTFLKETCCVVIFIHCLLHSDVSLFLFLIRNVIFFSSNRTVYKDLLKISESFLFFKTKKINEAS
jgi:hypothetical protein